MNRNVIIGIVVLVVIAVGGYAYSKSSSPSARSAEVSTVQPTAVTPDTTTGAVTVTYTKDGFSPKAISVKVGTKVTFINQSSNRMWVASDVHPSHEGYSGTTRSQHCPDTAGTAFDQCTAGDSYTFTFGKVGTWAYHNHVVDEDEGVVVVTE